MNDNGSDDIIIPIIRWTADNYERTHALFDDDMPDTFADWQKLLDAMLNSAPVGAKIEFIDLEPEDVAEWCRRERGKVTTEDRAVFAVEWWKSRNGH